MLPIESPRWKTFGTFFDRSEELPELIIRWRDSIGGPDEGDRWSELSDEFLHQLTIKDAAYAIVPHVVRDLARIEPRQRVDYLIRLGLTESARQRDTAPAVPDDLADAYGAAIGEAKVLAAASLSLDLPKIEFRYLLGAVASLHGHGGLGDILFHLDSLSGECARCGQRVYPEEVRASGYET